MSRIYDVIVIGGGPGGFTSAIYCTMAGFDTLVVEKATVGGQMCDTMFIENYPGFDNSVDGVTLGNKMQNTAKRYGAKVVMEEVTEVCLKDDIKIIKTKNNILYSKSVVVATGAQHKCLGIENEKKLTGRGVSYCATCDGMFYKNKVAAVVGGGNSALSAAIHLSKICKKVYVIHRRDTFRAMKMYVNSVGNLGNTEVCCNSIVEELMYENKLSGIKIRNVKSGEVGYIYCEGLFVSIGRTPETKLFKGQLDLDMSGYIVADESTRTNLKGVFAVGDVRTKHLRQIVTATADGAVAAHFIEEYLL